MVPLQYPLYGTTTIPAIWYHYNTRYMVPLQYPLYGTTTIPAIWYHYNTRYMVPLQYPLYGTTTIPAIWYHYNTRYMVPPVTTTIPAIWYHQLPLQYPLYGTTSYHYNTRYMVPLQYLLELLLPLPCSYLHESHIDLVHIRPLLPVHLHTHKTPVEQLSYLLALKGFSLHHMTPVTCGVANRQEDWFAFRLGLGKGFWTPWIPGKRSDTLWDQHYQ